MDWFLFAKWMHILSVISWMAGMLYLPRLYVYHAEQGAESEIAETFKVMERRLLRGIMAPASIATWGFGLWMVYLIPDWIYEPWLHAKFTFVVILTGIHHMLAKWRKDFEKGIVPHSGRFFRIINEVPALLMVGIVFFVIFKPF